MGTGTVCSMSFSTAKDGTCVGTHVSAHHFSEDGLNWHTLDAEPYSNAVEFAERGLASYMNVG